jgi:hypothetical protein
MKNEPETVDWRELVGACLMILLVLAAWLFLPAELI